MRRAALLGFALCVAFASVAHPAFAGPNPVSPCIGGTPGAPSTTVGTYLNCDTSGYLNVHIQAGGAAATFPYNGTADGQTATTASAVAIVLYNGTTYDRARSGGNSTDAQTTSSLGYAQTIDYNYGYNGTTWDRQKSGSNASSGVAYQTTGVQQVNAYLYADNGSSWDKVGNDGAGKIKVSAYYTGSGGQASYSPILCNKSTVISQSTAATTQVIAASGSTAIYICGYNFIATGATNVTIVQGTGTNCGTGQATMTGAYPLSANSGVSYANGYAALFGNASQAVCITGSAAVQVSGVITWTQF